MDILFIEIFILEIDFIHLEKLNLLPNKFIEQSSIK